MANNIKVNHNEIGNSVLFNLQNHSVILEQLNKDYADQTFIENPIGLKNQSVEIIKTLESAPATVFLNQITTVEYNESSVTLVIDKLFDKSHSFKVNEQSLNPGAIKRAGETAGNSCKDGMEIYALEQISLNAVPISLPSGSLSTADDYSTLEKFMIDNKIKSSESVVFINSKTRQKMTSNTTLFSYSRNKDAKFSDGLGGNEEYSQGSGYVTTEYGMNFYLSDKLSPNYEYFTNNSIETFPLTNYISGTAKVVSIDPNNDIYIEVDNSVENFAIAAGNFLNIDNKIFKLTENVYHYKQAEVGVNTILIKTISVKDNYSTLLINKDVNLELNPAKKYRNFILSNKSVAFACKAPAVVAADQVVVSDNTTGVSSRVSSFYNGNTKELTISVDCWAGVKVIIDNIGTFAS